MKDKTKIGRRAACAAIVGAGSGLLMTGLAVAQQRRRRRATSQPKLSFDNSDFYNAEGKFDVEAGKDAYIQVMKHHGYPMLDDLRKNLWVSDYALGKFTELGLGAFVFLNDEDGRYMGLDIFLLPNQMLPEHHHVETDKGPAKLEGWLCRHGIAYVYDEGATTENIKAVIPDFEKDHVTVRHETILRPGQTAQVTRRTARHWQFAGPEGAILTEVACYHDGAGVIHTDPKIVFE